jgi:hypothetical protein
MSEVVGSAVVEIHARIDALEREIRRGTVRASEKAGKDSGKIFGSSFKRNVAAFTGGLLAAGGIVGVSRTLINLGKDSLKAASDQSAANAIVSRAVKNAGTEMTIFGKSIEQALQAESLLTGIADDELAPAFVRLLRVTQDNQKAFDGLRLAEDLARQQGISVATAALAISRAYQGNIGSLGRYGIVLQGVTADTTRAEKATSALARIGEIAGGTAITFAASDAGKLQRAAVTFEEIKETLGQAILPTVGRIAERIATWFADPKNQERVERGIERTADAVEQIIDASITAGRVLATPFEKAAEKGRALNAFLQDTADLVGKIGNDEAFTNKVIEQRTKQLTEQLRLRRLGATEGLTAAERGTTGTPNIAVTPANRAGLQGVAGVSTFDPNRRRQIAELQAALTQSDADNRVLAEARRKNLQSQIDAIGDPRGKNDQDRLIRLFEELGDVTDEINSIEEDANKKRADAAEERKRLAQDERDRLKQEREEAAQKLADEKAAAAQAAKDRQERLRSLKESRLSLRVQQAELTKTTRDDKAAIRAQVRFYGEQAKNFRKTGALTRAVEAESNKVAAQLALRGLRRPGGGTESTAGAARTDFFQEAANQFRTFGSNIGRSGDPLSGQQARGQFAGLALERGRNTASLTLGKLGEQLGEQQLTNTILRGIKAALQGTAVAAGSLPPRRLPPHATALARDNARNQLAGR